MAVLRIRIAAQNAPVLGAVWHAPMPCGRMQFISQGLPLLRWKTRYSAKQFRSRDFPANW